MTRLSFTLLKNSHDFLEEALRNAIEAKSEPDRWKFAVLSIVQSIELLLKELLAEVHPLFVYANIDKPSKTVSLDIAVSRLKAVADLSLSKEEIGALNFAKETRHQIVHSGFDVGVEEVQLAFSMLLGFLSELHDRHFDTPLYEIIDNDLWAEAVGLTSFGKDVFRNVEARLSESYDPCRGDHLARCYKCGWKSLIINEDREGHCYVCGLYEGEIRICERCDDAIQGGEENISNEKAFCDSCHSYITDDYWHETLRGK